MSKAKLQFVIEKSDELLPLGAKRIELLFNANAGEDLLPLHKVPPAVKSRVSLWPLKRYLIPKHLRLWYSMKSTLVLVAILPCR